MPTRAGSARHGSSSARAWRTSRFAWSLRSSVHATIARFIERHETALGGLFGEVLLLCARSGLAKVGVSAIDGTKVHASAGRDANLDYEALGREILEEAKAVDAAGDELYGDARGDELPEE